MTRVVVKPQVNKVRILGCFDPNYGSFYYINGDFTYTEVAPLPLNNTAFNKHVELGEGGAIVFKEKGKYNIQFSIQLEKLIGGTHELDIWIKQNGLNVADSNSSITVSGGSGTKSVVGWNWFVEAEANDYVQLYWWSDTTGAFKMESKPATGERPAIPGLILTVNQVG